MAKPEKGQMTVAEASSLVASMAKNYRAFARIQEVLQVAASVEGVEASSRRKLHDLEAKVAEAELESTTAIEKFKAATASAAQKYKKEVERRQDELGKLNEARVEVQGKIDALQEDLKKKSFAAAGHLEQEVARRTAVLTELEERRDKAEKDLDRLARRIAG